MLNRDIVFPSLMIVLSLVILTLVPQFEMPSYQQDASVGAKFFPAVLAIGQIIICVALIIQHQLKKNAEQGKANPIFSKMSLAGLVFLVVYVALISITGYLPASLLTFTGYLAFMKVKKPLYYVVAWVFVLAVYYLFANVFFISLPTGMFY